ncbi:MAG: dehydrogenase [Sphingomonas bacterium]|uniref:YciI family protein n=1 Tax=Sphingomonas bacterium TaxID=1895847 RepID=UPI0026049639|nr:YciI family protein [Sphingomonas bacterium]MDB5706119.1 dehydrogenase [Sphingomonas bacterium]
MRVMVIMKASPESEAGIMPSEQLLTDMTAYNEELVKAGIMLAGEGLHPSSKGARVRFEGNTTSVLNGPFAETKELIAGFWLLQVKSMDEAIEWIRRVPNTDGAHHEIEIRQVFDASDFGEAFTPELQEREEAMRAQTGHYGESQA